MDNYRNTNEGNEKKDGNDLIVKTMKVYED